MIPPVVLGGQNFGNIKRIDRIDALRGTALVLMVCYHFGFDLNSLGWIHYDINYDLRWLTARALILGSFLGLVGASLALAELQGKTPQSKLVRVVRVALAAGLVTAGSWLFIPAQTIYFGTLHAIALMSLLIQWRPMPVWGAAVIGVAIIVLGSSFAHSVFNHPGLAWLGLMTYKPLTADYVPMLPWSGVCVLGYAMMKALLAAPGATMQKKSQWPALAWLGRHSLAVYLIHQPLLLGVLIPVTRYFRSM